MIRNAYRRFVILFGAHRSRFIALNRATTSDRSKATKFYIADEAKAFADQKAITLSPRTSIEQEDFVASELRQGRFHYVERRTPSED
ncbi:MAG: hypothetical protein H8K03_14430 [Nitrospira sp.]